MSYHYCSSEICGPLGVLGGVKGTCCMKCSNEDCPDNGPCEICLDTHETRKIPVGESVWSIRDELRILRQRPDDWEDQ